MRTIANANTYATCTHAHGYMSALANTDNTRVACGILSTTVVHYHDPQMVCEILNAITVMMTVHPHHHQQLRMEIPDDVRAD